MRAAVLGATGFLGSGVVAALHAGGHAVTALTRRPHLVPAGVAVADLGPSWPVRAPLTAALARLRPDVVVNAAGEIWAPERAAHALANVELADHLVMAIGAALPDRPPRLVHLGSSLEYAPVAPPSALREDAPLVTAAQDAYTRSKLAGTRLVLRAAAERGLDVVVARVFNAIGPGVSTASVLGRAAAELLRAHRARDTARITLLAVDQHRDYVDVRDVAAAVAAAATTPLPPGPHVVNIGAGQARATEDVVCAFADHTGVPYRVDRRGGAGRAAAAAWQLADIGLARRLLGWTPTTPLHRTLTDIWVATAPPSSTALPHQTVPHHHVEGEPR